MKLTTLHNLPEGSLVNLGPEYGSCSLAASGKYTHFHTGNILAYPYLDFIDSHKSKSKYSPTEKCVRNWKW